MARFLGALPLCIHSQHPELFEAAAQVGQRSVLGAGSFVGSQNGQKRSET